MLKFVYTIDFSLLYSEPPTRFNSKSIVDIAAIIMISVVFFFETIINLKISF